MEDNIRKQKKLSKTKLAIAILIIILLISIIVLFIMYCKNEKFRNWVDINILLKQIHQGNTVSIEFNGENSSNVYAFDKYVVTLENKILKIYNTLGTEEATISIDINEPIFDTAGKYLAIAEQNGEEIYLLEGKQVLWHNTLEGEILQIEINDNGYIGIVMSDISYENIITVYNAEGKSLLKTYVATNKVIDISISKNNQYLAIAEVDMSGVVTQSSIRIIDIVKAKTDANNSIIYTYSAEIGKLITNIQYQSKERLLCSYNDSIDIIQDSSNNNSIKLSNTKMTFASIELNNNIVTVEETDINKYDSGSCAKITNIVNNKTKSYEMAGIAKQIYTYDKVIALNVGTELHIINTNGWLMKKYISEQEINDIVISDKVVGVIFRDTIEIIDL